MKIKLRNKKIGIYKNGIALPRCYWRKAKGKTSPSVLVKCGDCDNKVEVYYSKEDIEINGVLASVEWWDKFFKYLMERKRNNGKES